VRSGDRSAGYDPLHRLAGDLRDQLVIAVVVQNGDSFSFGHCRDQQVRQADRPDKPAPPQGALDIKRAPPVFIMGGQPLIASVAIGSYLIELRAAAGSPVEDSRFCYASRSREIHRLRGASQCQDMMDSRRTGVSPLPASRAVP
jgi:hypothetical protein